MWVMINYGPDIFVDVFDYKNKKVEKRIPASWRKDRWEGDNVPKADKNSHVHAKQISASPILLIVQPFQNNF